MAHMMKTALVTGSAGFVGRHLVKRLKDVGYHVVGIDPREDSPSSVERFTNVAAGYTFDVVVHLAANIPDVDQRMKGSHEAYADIITDFMMVDFLADFPPRQCVVWPTSCAVDNPEDPYAWVKLTGEKLFKTLKSVPVYMLRPYSGYGSDQALSYPFPAILDRVMRRLDPVEVWGSGQQVRDFIHIDDLVNAFMLAIAHKFPAYTPIEIGTGVGTKLVTLAQMMADEVGYKPIIHPLTEKAESGRRRVADTYLAEQHGFKAEVSLKEGIRRAISERSGS